MQKSKGLSPPCHARSKQQAQWLLATITMPKRRGAKAKAAAKAAKAKPKAKPKKREPEPAPDSDEEVDDSPYGQIRRMWELPAGARVIPYKTQRRGGAASE